MFAPRADHCVGAPGYTQIYTGEAGPRTMQALLDLWGLQVDATVDPTNKALLAMRGGFGPGPGGEVDLAMLGDLLQTGSQLG